LPKLAYLGATPDLALGRQAIVSATITARVAATAVATLASSAARDQMFERIVERLLTCYTTVAFAAAADQIRQERQRLQTPTAYEPVGRALARLCQSLPDSFPEHYADSTWLPAVIRELGPKHPHATRVHSDGMTLGTGSGAAGFWGYQLKRDTNVVAAVSNLWHLSYFGSERSEGEGFSTNLTSFWLAKNDQVNRDELVENALNAYAREVKRGYAATIPMQARVNFVRELAPGRLQEVCQDAIKDSPEHWWPRLTLALLGSISGPRPDAVEAFADYVQRLPSYSRYLWLAYLYQVLGRDADAAAAVEQAIRQPVIDLHDDMWNTEARGYAAGVYLLTTGHHATVVLLCDALLPVRENGDYAKPAIQALRVAAVEGAAGRLVQFRQSEHMLKLDPYEYTDLQALRAWIGPSAR